MQLSFKENKFITNIYRFGRKKRFAELQAGSFFLALIALVFGLSITLADHQFYFSQFTRWGLLLVNLALWTWLLIIFFFKLLGNFVSFKQNSDLTPTAEDIGQYFPEFKDLIVNTYHLIIRPSVIQTSEELRRAAVKDGLKQTSGINFKDSIRIKHYLPPILLTLSVLISALTLLWFHHVEIIHSAKRLINPSEEYLIVPPFRFSVHPGDTSALRGQSIAVKAVYSGPELQTCQLFIRSGGEKSGDIHKMDMHFQNQEFKTVIKDVRSFFVYQIKGLPLRKKQLTDHIWSDIFTVDVLIPPQAGNLDVILYPPPYSGLNTRRLDRNIGDITALAGTRAVLSFDINKELANAELVFGSGERVELQLKGLRAQGKFIIKDEDSYKISLRDTSGLENINKIEYQIGIIHDALPVIEITEPGHDVDSPLDALLQVKVKASDDYGIGKVEMYYRYLPNAAETADTIWQHFKLTPVTYNRRQQEFYHIWNFNKMPLTFEDALEYYTSAEDNRRPGPAGKSRTQSFLVRFPSLDELFDSFAEEQDQQTEELEDVVRDSEELKKTLGELSRDLKKTDNIQWEQKQQISKALDKQKQLQEKLDDIKEKMNELIEKLDQNNMISGDVLEKYSQLQELFRQVATPELMKAIRDLQKALDANNSQNMEKALEQFKLNQEAFKEKIERTMELLKQVQLEQKMDQLVQKAKSLREQQERISRQISDQQNPQKDDFKKMENSVKNQSQNLKELERDLHEMNKEPRLSHFKETKDLLNEAADKIADPGLDKDMKQLSRSLSSENKSGAETSSKKLENRFQDIENTLSSSQQKMLNQNKAEIKQKMARAMQRLLKLSHEQEKIQKKTQKASPLGDGLKDISAQQGKLYSNFQKAVSDIIGLSKETFFINPSISKSLGKTQQNIQNSLDQLSERNKSAAARGQKKAMGGLNESARHLHNSMQQLDQSGSGTGFEQFMEQMRKMAGMQGQLNEETIGLFQAQGNSGQLSLQQQGEIHRLAAEQGALRKALQQLHEKMGQRDDILGDMGRLSAEMDEVVQDLLKQNVDRKTINRQRKILSRMLDAQKSLEQRRYSKKRKAQLAKKYLAKDPRVLIKKNDVDIEALQRALSQALKEGYSQEYQLLIEAYFKSLIERENAGTKN